MMNNTHLRFILIGLAMTLTSIVHAQIPADIAAQLKAMGRVVNPPATAAIYAPRQLDKEPYQGVNVLRDIAYGPDARNLLDVFVPTAATATPRKVFIFVHGGGFTRGNKRTDGSPFYENVMLWATKNNMIGVNMTYRLAPKDVWPAAQQDIGQAVGWVLKNIAARGGDPKQVFLMGQSAGAAHVASYLAYEPAHAAPGSGIAAALILSGIFKLAPGLEDAAAVSYFGSDPAVYPARLAQEGLLKSRVPLWIAYSELDPMSFELQFNNIKDVLCKAGRCPATHIFAGHSHMSEIYSINSDDPTVGNAMWEFVKAH